MKDIAVYLIKSFDSIKYANNFIQKGEMYFNCPEYYRYLGFQEMLEEANGNYDKINWDKPSSKGISDLNEATVANTIGIYRYTPIYCMYTVGAKDVFGNKIRLRKKAFEEFKNNGHSCFVICKIKDFFDRLKSSLGEDFASDFIKYQKATPKTEMQYLQSRQEVLFRKSPYFCDQQEYRIILPKEKIETKLFFNGKNYTICLTNKDKYKGIIKEIGNISDFSKLITYDQLKSCDNYYYFSLNTDKWNK